MVRIMANIGYALLLTQCRGPVDYGNFSSLVNVHLQETMEEMVSLDRMWMTSMNV